MTDRCTRFEDRQERCRIFDSMLPSRHHAWLAAESKPCRAAGGVVKSDGYGHPEQYRRRSSDRIRDVAQPASEAGANPALLLSKEHGVVWAVRYLVRETLHLAV